MLWFLLDWFATSSTFYSINTSQTLPTFWLLLRYLRWNTPQYRNIFIVFTTIKEILCFYSSSFLDLLPVFSICLPSVVGIYRSYYLFDSRSSFWHLIPETLSNTRSIISVFGILVNRQIQRILRLLILLKYMRYLTHPPFFAISKQLIISSFNNLVVEFAKAWVFLSKLRGMYRVKIQLSARYFSSVVLDILVSNFNKLTFSFAWT